MAMKTKEGYTLDNSAMLEMLRERFPDSIFVERGNTVTRIPKSDKKQECLDHYAECEPQQFAQFDGWDLSRIGSDDIMPADEDGHCLCHSHTWELRRSPDDLAVRVFIPVDANPRKAAAILQKLADYVAEIAEENDATFRARKQKNESVPF